MLIIGVGNTAMDCCRTSRRLGGKDVKVIARRSRPYFKASPWELEDAEEEGVEIVENHAPEALRPRERQARRHGVRAPPLDDENGKQKSEVIDTVIIPCDDVILAIGQENAFPWIERDIGIEFDDKGMPVVDRTDDAVARVRASSSAATRRGDRRTSSGPSSTGIRRRSRSTITARASRSRERPAYGMNLVSAKMGLHEWSYSNDYNPVPRTKMQHVELAKRFESSTIEVELGFTAEQTAREVERCLNCDIQTALHRRPVHRVRRLHRRLPGELSDDHARRADGARSARRVSPRRR